MKKIITLVLVIFFFLLVPLSASAVTVELLGYRNGNSCPPGTPNCAGITSDRSLWAELAEVENVSSDSRISAAGSLSLFNVGSAPWNRGMWIFGAPGYVEVTFTAPSDSLFVQFESDSNDGLANFIIDGTPVTSINTHNGSWFAVVFTGLTNSAHTIRVQALSTGFPRDLAIDVIGSGAPTNNGEIPEPATMLLLGFGLAGAAFRRKGLTQ